MEDSTIRAILHNESYIGHWRYKTKQWRKFPGTNRRLPIRRDDADVIARDYPDRRIVDQDTWDAVQARLRAVSAHYTKTKDGKAKGRSVPGRSSAYLFSSLLFCGACGGKMVISGGSGAHRHYRCEGHSKRGICKNDLSVREGVVRASLLDELRQRLASTDGVIYARKRIAERLGQIGRERNAEVRERRARLDKFDQQIEKLVAFVAEGHGSQAVADKLRTLEREATSERRTLAALQKQTTTPIRLPSTEDMLAIVFDLERRLMADVARGREELRHLFRDGRIDLIPQKGGFYVARSEILPLVLLVQPPSEENPGGRRYTASSCAGALRSLDHVYFEPLVFAMVA